MASPTPEAKILSKALRHKGINCRLQDKEEYNQVDIAIETADLYIRIEDKLGPDKKEYYLTNEKGLNIIHVHKKIIKKKSSAIASSILEYIMSK